MIRTKLSSNLLAFNVLDATMLKDCLFLYTLFHRLLISSVWCLMHLGPVLRGGVVGRSALVSLVRVLVAVCYLGLKCCFSPMCCLPHTINDLVGHTSPPLKGMKGLVRDCCIAATGTARVHHRGSCWLNVTCVFCL